MQVVIDRDPSYAPCAYLICQCDKHGNWNTRDDARTVLVQTDWDYPGVAAALGFRPCECGATDGTVDCEHKTATQMISEAADFLDAHLGEQFEDTGYFERS